HEAEQYAAEDKKRKEEVETRNNAEQLVFQSEKALTDLGDKLSADEKSAVQSEIDKVKEALKGTDSEMIRMATESLSKKFGELASKIYQQQAPQGDPNMGATPGAGAQGDFVDADFTEVKDDDKK
ncbi:MAG: molecular chaperone DnaK, partial [Clostridia bacterium]|nr:molecular chaperone DnaK [Clostridia bacterium]